MTGWELPEAFATLRRLLEARMGKRGKREFVQVLRLMEVFRVDDVAAGVRDAIDRRACRSASPRRPPWSTSCSRPATRSGY